MRPRERYALHGSDEFGDADLLALVLGTGCVGRPVERICADLLQAAGGLHRLPDLPVAALAKVSGVGPARAVRLHAALALGRRALAAGSSEPRVQGIGAAVDWFRPRMCQLRQEELHGLYLNKRGVVLAYQVLTRGNDSHTIVDPRQVYRHALLHNASAVIVAHNHPSGDPTPSCADVDVSVRLARAGALLGIDLLDHLVLGDNQHRSLREDGLMPAPSHAGASIAAKERVRGAPSEASASQPCGPTSSPSTPARAWSRSTPGA